MPRVFAERFVITVLAGICLAVVLYNPMQFTAFQRILAVTIVICSALLISLRYETKPRLPKPVLHWQGYMGHPAITPDFFKVETAEGSSVVSLFLQNEGNANLTQARLYVKYESGYEVIADQDSKRISTNLEKEVGGFRMDLPVIYPAPAEPFRFNLTINSRMGGSSVPTWAVTSVMMLYFKVEAEEVPSGLDFHPLEVTHR